MIRPFDRSMFGSWNGFRGMAPGIRQRVVITQAELPSDADVIAGHIALSTILSRYPRAKLLTVMREPRSRIVSHFLYWRMFDDYTIAKYGDWGKYIAFSRLSLGDFLSQPEIACQIDNVFTRMLLWPHPQIPDADFIDPRHDVDLLKVALTALDRFDHAGVVSNPALFHDLSTWLRHVYGRSYWTTAKPALADRRVVRSNEARIDAADFDLGIRQAVAESTRLLERATRLDRPLWETVVRRRMPGEDPATLAERIFAAALDRYGGLRRSSRTDL